jgi:hypothetical protein
MTTKVYVGFTIGKRVHYAAFHNKYYVMDIHRAHLYGEAYAKKLISRFTEELKGYPNARVVCIRVPIPQ